MYSALLLMGPLFDIALAGVAEEESGSVSGVLKALLQLGGSTGVAALGPSPPWPSSSVWSA